MISKKNKRAYFFILDAMIAMILMMSIATIAPTYYPKQYYFSSVLGQDVLNVLSNLKIEDAAQEYETIQEWINNGNITDTSISVLEQIAIFWTQGKEDMARELTKEMFRPLQYANKNIGLWIEQDNNMELVYSINKTEIENSTIVVPAKTFISGTETEEIVGTEVEVPKMDLRIVEVRIWGKFS